MSLRPEQLSEAINLLEKIALFQGTSMAQQAAMASVLEFRTLAKGKVALLEQEISRTLYILSKGSVGIWRRKNNQKDRIALLEAPNFFGEISMFADVPATALVKTEEDSQFFVLTRQSFEVLVQKDAALGELIHRNSETLKAARPQVQKPPPANPA